MGMVYTENDYVRALEAAGAEILAFEEFGSDQGDWWAKVVYRGQTGWINGSYGSCSGCDAFQSEFGWNADQSPQRLAAFGERYLDEILTQEAAEAQAAKNITWDLDAPAMLAFVQAHVENVRSANA